MALVEKTLATADEVKKFLKGKTVRTQVKGDANIWLIAQVSALVKYASSRPVVINVSWMDNDPDYLFLESIDKKIASNGE